MYDYNLISSSRKYGGQRTVLTGTSSGVTSGKYLAKLDEIPEGHLGCIPAGTPAHFNDETREVSIHYAFEVMEAVSGTSLKLKKGYEGSRVKNGMKLMLAPTTVLAEGDASTVTEVDRTNDAYDLVTIDAAITGVKAGDVLVEAKVDGGKATMKVVPNAITFRDYVKAPGSFEFSVDGLYAQVDGVLLERRVPPFCSAVKSHFSNEGNVYIRFSKSKE